MGPGCPVTSVASSARNSRATLPSGGITSRAGPYDEGRADLRRIAENKLAGDPVRLNRDQAEVVRHQFEETASYRGWQLLAGAIMANHVHLVVGVAGDPDPSALLRDFKSYSSRALNLRDRVSVKPRWWTEQGFEAEGRGLGQSGNRTAVRPRAGVRIGGLGHGERGASAPCPRQRGERRGIGEREPGLQTGG